MNQQPSLDRRPPLLRARALAHVSLTRRDPDAMGRFLVDFGFHALGGGYFRTHAAGLPWSVRIVPSDEDSFSGFAFQADKVEDLDVFAGATQSKVMASEAPGGGVCVATSDPCGFQVELVFYNEQISALSKADDPFPINRPGRIERVNTTVRPPLASAPVFKLGHIVLQTPAFAETSDWYAYHFGLILSDIEQLPDGSPVLGFYRLDRGEEPTDHHTVAFLAGGSPRLLHVSTETSTIDALGQGQQFLKSKGWEHYWGIGRHELGSQIFDYWKDPAGDEWEHYIDGDMMNEAYPTGYHQFGRSGLWSWGCDLPASMRPELPLEAIPDIHAAGGFGSMTLEQAKQFIEAFQAPPRPWLK